MVRIHLPPAESQVRTCLSREFAFLGREAAVFCGCPGRDERPGSAETRGRGNIRPKGGDISVGRYSSTAPPVTICQCRKTRWRRPSRQPRRRACSRPRRPYELDRLRCGIVTVRRFLDREPRDIRFRLLRRITNAGRRPHQDRCYQRICGCRSRSGPVPSGMRPCPPELLIRRLRR